MPTVHLAERDGVAVLTLARPPVNAIDADMVDAIHDALGAVRARALVVTGDGACFSAGVDVKAIRAYDDAIRQRTVRGINTMLLRLYGLPIPTVAAVNGHALGGGLMIALGCDVRIVARGAHRLGLTEVTAGVPFPAVPIAVARAELTPAAARRLVLTGQVVGPDDAVALAVLDECVDAETLLDRACETAKRLAAAPAYAAVKRQLRAPLLRELERLAAAPDDVPLSR